MTFVSEVLNLLRTWIEDDSIDDSFITFINLAIREAEGMIDWPSLYLESTETAASGVVTAPAEMHKLLAIYSVEESGNLPKYKFSLRDSQPTSETGHIVGYTAEPMPPVDETFASFEASITTGSEVIENADESFTPDSTLIGKRLMLSGYPDLYEVLEVDGDDVTLSRAVPFIDDALVAYVQPEGTERFYLTDKSSNPISADVLFKFQRKHPTIAQSTDRILINCPHTIALLALQNALITDKYSVDAQRLNESLILAKNREIGGATFNRKVNKFKDTMFSVRGNGTRRWSNGQA